MGVDTHAQSRRPVHPWTRSYFSRPADETSARVRPAWSVSNTMSVTQALRTQSATTATRIAAQAAAAIA
jgi:hypothetical protein